MLLLVLFLPNSCLSPRLPFPVLSLPFPSRPFHLRLFCRCSAPQLPRSTSSDLLILNMITLAIRLMTVTAASGKAVPSIAWSDSSLDSCWARNVCLDLGTVGRDRCPEPGMTSGRDAGAAALPASTPTHEQEGHEGLQQNNFRSKTKQRRK